MLFRLPRCCNPADPFDHKRIGTQAACRLHIHSATGVFGCARVQPRGPVHELKSKGEVVRAELDSRSARAIAAAALRRAQLLALFGASALLSLPLAVGNAVHASEMQQLMVKLRDSRSARAAVVSGDVLDALSASVGVPLERVRRMSGGAQVLRLPGVTTPVEAEAVARQLR